MMSAYRFEVIVCILLLLLLGYYEASVSNKKRILVNDPNVLSQEVALLKQKLTELEVLTKNQQSTIQSLQTKVNSKNQGATYVRWGRKECHNSTELVYTGFTGGDEYRSGGGPSNYLCLPIDPTWGSQTNSPNWYDVISGAEYETSIFGKNTPNEDVPCAVCRTQNPSVIMIPARTSCYAGWRLEYSGTLAGGNDARPSEYVCIDDNPDVIIGGVADDNSGVRFYPVKIRCGPLPCPPYINDKYVACVVCSK